MEDNNDDAVIIVDLPEEQQQNSTTQFPHKRDGERSKNRGPCPCGYRHWCEGKEYDFVFQWPGINALGGFNLSDNAFTIAEDYVTKYHRSSKWDHRNIVNQIAHAIMRQTDRSSHQDVVKTTNDKSNFDPFKEDYNVPQVGTTRYNKVTGKFEKTIYPLNEAKLTPEEEAEMKRKQAILEENQKKLMKEKEEEDKRREGIVEIIRRDRIESAEKEIKVIEHKSTNTAGKIAKLEGGVVVWVDPPSIKLPKNPLGPATVRSISDLSHDYPHHHHGLSASESDEEEEDEIEKLSRLPKLFWNDHIFLKLLSKHGEEITKKVMLTVGFGESELEEILFKGKEHLKRHKKMKLKEKEPKQNGRRLGNNNNSAPAVVEEKKLPSPVSTSSPSPPPAPPPTSLTVDIDSPTTTIKIRLIDGSTKEVTANHSHKISEIIDYIRCLTGVSEFKLVNTSAFPRKTLTEFNLTIKEANLLNTNLTQTP